MISKEFNLYLNLNIQMGTKLLQRCSHQYIMIMLLMLTIITSQTQTNSRTVCSLKPNVKCTLMNVGQSLQKKCDEKQTKDIGQYYLFLCLLKDSQQQRLNIQVKSKDEFEEYFLNVDQNFIASNPLFSFFFQDSPKKLYDQMKDSTQISINQNGVIIFRITLGKSVRSMTFLTTKREVNIERVLMAKSLRLEKANEVLQAKLKQQQQEKNRKISELQQRLIKIDAQLNLPKQTQLTRQQLLKYVWAFYNDDKFLGEMTFELNGSISWSNQVTNEAYWSLENRGILIFYHTDRRVSCRFIQSFKDYNNMWNLQGKFMFFTSWRHFLVQLRLR